MVSSGHAVVRKAKKGSEITLHMGSYKKRKHTEGNSWSLIKRQVTGSNTGEHAEDN